MLEAFTLGMFGAAVVAVVWRAASKARVESFLANVEMSTCDSCNRVHPGAVEVLIVDNEPFALCDSCKV